MSDRELKTYVLVRRDLTPSQRVVQACHAVVALVRQCGDDPKVREWADRRHTLVVLGVGGERELLRWRQRLSDAGVPVAVFIEPDMNGEATAIAVHPAADPNLFRSRMLL